MKYPTHYELPSPLNYLPMRAFCFKLNDESIRIITTEEPDGWEHLSVSFENRTPTWDEMCFIKELFFDPEDLCIQMHPRQSQYINMHAHCLHIWKPPVNISKLLERTEE